MDTISPLKGQHIISSKQFDRTLTEVTKKTIFINPNFQKLKNKFYLTFSL
jgi:hypothetical protein